MSKLNFLKLTMIGGKTVSMEIHPDGTLAFWMESGLNPTTKKKEYRIAGNSRGKVFYQTWVEFDEMNFSLMSYDEHDLLLQIWGTLTQKQFEGGTDPEQCLRAFNSERNICSQLGALDWKPFSLGMYTA
jgi:hypothetical protein